MEGEPNLEKGFEMTLSLPRLRTLDLVDTSLLQYVPKANSSLLLEVLALCFLETQQRLVLLEYRLLAIAFFRGINR